MISPYFNLSGSDARGLLYGLMETDKIQLREHPNFPSMRQLIQDGRVRYRQADPQEHWQSYKELVEQTRDGGIAYGDCEDLATALAAEDQVRYGVNSVPYAYAPREGLFHVVTAVPSDQFGGIPRHSWPGAKGAPPIPGYVLQDPSAAAGMGSGFGGLPGKEAPLSHSYGATSSSAPRRRRGAGLGGVLSALKQGLIGEEKAVEAAFELGAGAREGLGVKKGWASSLGRDVGSRFSPVGGSPEDQEAAAVASIQKGAASEKASEEDDFSDEDMDAGDEEFGFFGRMWFDDDPDLDFSEDDLDDEFGALSLDDRKWLSDHFLASSHPSTRIGPSVRPPGLLDYWSDSTSGFGFEPEDLTGSPAWTSDVLATRVADDMFGLDDEDEDDSFGALDDGSGDYSMGIFRDLVDDFDDDLHEDVGPRSSYGEDRFSPLEHMRPLPQMRGPISSPMASYAVRDEDSSSRSSGSRFGFLSRDDLFGQIEEEIEEEIVEEMGLDDDLFDEDDL